MLYLQLMPVWKSSSFFGDTMIMNKKSQFIKIFSQAILDLKNTGTWDIMNVENSRQMDQSYSHQIPQEHPLGYKKLAFLFAVLASGTFISLFIALFEVFAKMYQIQKSQKPTTTNTETNPTEDNLRDILNNMSKDEIIQRILQNVHQE